MPVCALHPQEQRETMLSCGVCDKPICVECVVHTAVGLRCLACAHGLKVQQSATPTTLPVALSFSGNFVLGALCALLLPWLMGAAAPVVAMYELVVVVGLAAYYRVPVKRHILIGLVYTFIYVIFVLIPLLSAALPKHVALAHLRLSQLHSSASAAAICVVGGVGVAIFLLAPARHAVRQLLEGKHEFVAGATTGSVIVVATFVFLAASVLLAAIR